MHIWVDADATPGVIKDILFRAAERVKMPMTLVANKLLRVPPSAYIRALQVPGGFLVSPADIPLAAQAIDKGGHALHRRGEFYSKENIRERLNMRDFMEELRSSGVDVSGPAVFSQADRQNFTNQLDRFLARLPKTLDP
jgi:uncharacterized protein YaiI (UPF0178 family)